MDTTSTPVMPADAIPFATAIISALAVAWQNADVITVSDKIEVRRMPKHLGRICPKCHKAAFVPLLPATPSRSASEMFAEAFRKISNPVWTCKRCEQDRIEAERAAIAAPFTLAAAGA